MNKKELEAEVARLRRGIEAVLRDDLADLVAAYMLGVTPEKYAGTWVRVVDRARARLVQVLEGEEIPRKTVSLQERIDSDEEVEPL